MSSDSAITWKIHCRSPRSEIFRLLTTAEGRALFWAESAEERDGQIHFVFPNGQRYAGQILDVSIDMYFRIKYFDSEVEFRLEDSAHGGTEVTLVNSGVRDDERDEVSAGWASVLLALKAAADFGVDLRNHDHDRTWDAGYVDN